MCLLCCQLPARSCSRLAFGTCANRRLGRRRPGSALKGALPLDPRLFSANPRSRIHQHYITHGDYARAPREVRAPAHLGVCPGRPGMVPISSMRNAGLHLRH